MEGLGFRVSGLWLRVCGRNFLEVLRTPWLMVPGKMTGINFLELSRKSETVVYRVIQEVYSLIPC